MNRPAPLHAGCLLALVLGTVSCQDATAPGTPGAVQARPSADLSAHGGGPPGSIIYGCRPLGEDAELCRMNADGSGQTQVTDGTDGIGDFSSDLSTNGKRIVFSRALQFATDFLSSLYVMNVDGSGVNRLTFDEAFDFEPNWSPNGKQIVFTRVTPNFFGDADLAIINADGTELHDLVSRFEYDVNPVWSPDGKKIAFASNFGSQNGFFDLRIISPDGTGERNLTNTPDLDEGHPSWSPTGRQLAYEANGDIYVSNADGSGAQQLTTDPAFEFGPAWSRNGKQIYYAKDVGQGVFDIFVMNADASGQTNLTNTPDVDESRIHVR